MPLIDYSNISIYNVSALTDVNKFSDIFLSVDNMFGVKYLFGTISLVVLFTVIMLIFRDYDFKVSSLVASTLTLFVALIYYFMELIAWQHLLVSFGLLILTILATWKWTE